MAGFNSRPAIMGIVNCSTDSFSGDGADAATLSEQCAAMVAAGASWLDVGAVSSRPGASEVSEAEEWQRLEPVLPAALATGAMVSVDTRRGSIARRALAQGVHMINDIAGGDDPELLQATARHGAAICLMHMQGEPATMQNAPRYANDDVIGVVTDFLHKRRADALAAGIAHDKIFLDPGIGFGKTTEHNLLLLKSLPKMRAVLGGPWLLGISRKRFLPALVGEERPAPDRDHWSHIVHAQLAPWSDILRVHDVSGAAAALALTIRFHTT